MPNLYLQQSDGTPVATFRLYHDFAARAGQEEVVVLGIIPEAASANPAPAGSYTRTDEADWKARAEKAEKERDEARAGARVAFARCWELEKARQEAVDELYSLRATEPRPLTPDAINDEMVKRAHAAAAGFGTAADISASATIAMLTAALSEPPARPEGAEDLAELITEWDDVDGLSESQRTALADFMAAHGVRAARRDEEKR